MQLTEKFRIMLTPLATDIQKLRPQMIQIEQGFTYQTFFS